MLDIPETTIRNLVAKAKEVSKHAYCPYSKFRVGATVLTDTGDVFTGCNVENASHGLTICAERNAVFHMVAQAKQRIQALVIYTPTPKPAAPCGACRQVINEFGPEIFRPKQDGNILDARTSAQIANGGKGGVSPAAASSTRDDPRIDRIEQALVTLTQQRFVPLMHVDTLTHTDMRETQRYLDQKSSLESGGYVNV